MEIDVDGLNVSYMRSGVGKTIVLLHGWGSSKESFNDLFNALSEDFDIVALDFPGFGASSTPSEPWDVDQYTSLTHQFLKKLGVENIYAIVGHSFGGRVILKGCTSNQLDPEKIVFIGSAGIRHRQTLKKALFTLIAKLGKAALALPLLRHFQSSLRDKLYRAAGSSDYLQTDGVMRSTFVNVINEDLTHLLSEISQPTLLIWGSDDRETPLGDARSFAVSIPDATLRIVQEAGHFVHNDNPRKVNRWVKSFLD